MNQVHLKASFLKKINVEIKRQLIKEVKVLNKITNKKMQYMDVLLSYTETSDPQEIFQLLDILGQGAYGSVSKALHKQTGQLYAIKILPATSVNQISVIKKQIAILRDCNDEHIVKYFGSYFKDNNLWIVMEYCMAGSITDIVNITEKELNENQIASILESVLKGLKYLHDRKKIHRDIKAANILLDQSGNAKLADFGVSTQMMYTNARHNTHIGSPYWMSPEVIKYSEYNQKTDIWSLGVTAIQLAQGIVPYSHLKPFMAMWTMKDKPTQGFKQPQKWSPQFNDFVKQCLQINPEIRPEAEDLLHHDFIRKNSHGKKILAQLVHDSMAEIQNFRAGQAIKEEQSFSRSQLKEFKFAKGDSNDSAYESNTVIIKNSEKKNSQSIDSMNENNYFNKKNASNLQSGNRSIIYNDEDAECGSVIIKDDNDKGHSRNISQVSISSVVVKHNESRSEPKSKQGSNYLQSYIQNMQVMHSKQEEFKQTVQQKITKIQQNFIKHIQAEYAKVKNQLREFFLTNSAAQGSQGSQKEQKPAFHSQLFTSETILDYLYKSDNFTEERQKLQDQFKQKYLSNIHPVDNNYMSMMLESGNDEGSGELMQIIDGQDNIFLKDSIDMGQQCRKKSQSSADSPTSLFNNRKKNVKKLIIQEALQDPNVLLTSQQQSADNSSVNTEKNSRSRQKIQKQSNINKFLQKTPMISHNQSKNSRYKQIYVNSANFTGGTNNKNFIMTNYSNSTTTNMRGIKRVITTEPHQAYDYQNDSLSTLTKLNHRNLKQFYDDPVVFNNLKQLTQQSQEFGPTISLNPFQLKKNSFSKEIKSVKSKERQKDKITVLRQKQRATHIAHTAMAHNKDRTINNSNKKLKIIKVIEERQKSPEDNNQSIKTKNKKSKSKNKQTASTTIPFGSVGNMGALDYLPSKLGKSKEKKPSQIPVKSGPFSKIKNNKS